MWDQLPELILIKIFHYLNCEERFRASEVCQSWNRAVEIPELWRSVTIFIDKDLTNDFPLASELTEKYGRYIYTLELAWSRSHVLSKEELRNSLDAEARELLFFLAALKKNNVQLKQVILRNWYFVTNWHYRGKILFALAHFLGTQVKLEILNLKNSNLGLSDILRILRGVTRHCEHHLEALNLRGAFRDWQRPHNNSKFLGYVARLHALSTLQLDYPSVSNRCLHSLAAGASNSLRNLQISIRDTDSRQHIVENSAWHQLVLACPELTVSYTIVNISHFEEMSYLLQPSVPMARFQIYSGRVWDQSRSRNFRSTIGLLVTYYSSTLVEVILQIRHNREQLDDLLISMLKHCKLLTTLRYDGIIRNFEILDEILKLQSERKTQFKTIHVKPRRVNFENQELLNNIYYRYNPTMINQGVDFVVQHPYWSII